MTHSLTIEIPDEIYQPLVVRARQEGQSPESLAGDLVAHGLRPAGLSPELRKWAGSVNSGVSDAAQRHDDYLGQAQADQLRS
jgi:hypothetical protein